MNGRGWSFLGGVPLLDAATLRAFQPHPTTLARHLRAPEQWLAQAGADRAAVELAGAAVWLVAAWLGLALLTMAATNLPGAAGRWALASSRRLVPATLHPVLAGALGLGVLIAPVAASAHTSGGAHAGVVASASTSSPLPPPLWPTGSTTPHAKAPAHVTPDQYVVRPGDSLWLIASSRLPHATAAQIAAAWPQWYAANRSVIGEDPNLLQPGQVLHAPSSAQHQEAS